MSTEQRPDWNDVLRRAGVKRRRAQTALVLVSVTLLVGLFATPAFGLREAVLGLIGREDVEFEQGERAPESVRVRFEDLSLGTPPRMDPGAIVGESRRVATFRVRGKERPLWVAPTERGGFCWFLEGSSGGCLRQEAGAPLPDLLATHGMSLDRSGEVRAVGTLSGWLSTPGAARVTIVFENGETKNLPFVYISAPIDAGFFTFTLQKRHAPEGARPAEIVVRDAVGDVLVRERLRYDAPVRVAAPAPAPSRPRELPATPPVPPSEPLQRGESNGVAVTVGANEVVLFDASAASAELRRLLRGNVTYACFRARGETGQRSLGHWGGFADSVALRFFNLGTPFDGCEIQGSYGHRWPDRNGSHSAVEVAFTPAAERYFEERAAARDLALFIRARKVQQLRKLGGGALEQALTAEFGDRIDRLGSAGASPAAGRIGYWPGADRAVFRRASRTGRVFEIEVREGKIVRDNLGELALVF